MSFSSFKVWSTVGSLALLLSASARADDAANNGIAPDATVTLIQPKVDVWRAGKPDWSESRAGDTLNGLDQLRTSASAGATLRFRDRTILRLGQNALIAVDDSGESTRTRHRSSALELTQGEARIFPGGALGTDVTTPSAEVAFAGATISVAVDEKKGTRVSVFDGSAVVTAQGHNVAVQPGYGTRVPDGGRPEDPQQLPSTPAWTGGGGLDTVLAVKRTAPMMLRWEESSGAVAYRIEVSRDERFENHLIDRLAGAKAPHEYEAPQMEIGRYFTRISAMSAGGLYSAPSETKMTDVRQLVLESGGPGPKSGTITGAVEIRVRIPEGGRVTVDGVAEKQSPVVIRGVGVHQLRVTVGSGTPQMYECTVDVPRAKVGFTKDLKHAVIQFFDRQGRPVAFLRRPDVNLGLRGQLGSRALEPEPVGDGHEWRAEIIPYRAMSTQIGAAIEVIWNGQSIGGGHAEATVEQ